MTALTVQNFVSAAAGVAVSIALIRGFARKQANTIGNFWVDLVRATLYIFLPLSLAGRPLSLLARRHPELQTLHHREDGGGRRRRPSPRGRSLRKKPSRWWGQTEADSSTPIPLIPLRTPRP